MKAHTNKTPTSNDTNIKKAIVYFPFMVVIFVICVFSSIAASKLEKSRPSLEQVGNDKYARPGYNVAKSAGSVGDSGDENSEFDNDYMHLKQTAVLILKPILLLPMLTMWS